MQWFALATPFIFQWRKCFHVTKLPNSHSGNVRTCYQHVGHAEHDGWREFQLIWIRFHEVDNCTHSSTFFMQSKTWATQQRKVVRWRILHDLTSLTLYSIWRGTETWWDWGWGARSPSSSPSHTHNLSFNNSHQTCSQTYHHAFFTQFMQDAHSFNDFWLERHVLSPHHALRTPHAIISDFYFNTQQKHQ